MKGHCRETNVEHSSTQLKGTQQPYIPVSKQTTAGKHKRHLTVSAAESECGDETECAELEEDDDGKQNDEIKCERANFSAFGKSNQYQLASRHGDKELLMFSTSQIKHSHNAMKTHPLWQQPTKTTKTTKTLQREIKLHQHTDEIARDDEKNDSKKRQRREEGSSMEDSSIRSYFPLSASSSSVCFSVAREMKKCSTHPPPSVSSAINTPFTISRSSASSCKPTLFPSSASPSTPRTESFSSSGPGSTSGLSPLISSTNCTTSVTSHRAISAPTMGDTSKYVKQDIRRETRILQSNRAFAIAHRPRSNQTHNRTILLSETKQERHTKLPLFTDLMQTPGETLSSIEPHEILAHCATCSDPSSSSSASTRDAMCCHPVYSSAASPAVYTHPAIIQPAMPACRKSDGLVSILPSMSMPILGNYHHGPCKPATGASRPSFSATVTEYPFSRAYAIHANATYPHCHRNLPTRIPFPFPNASQFTHSAPLVQFC